MMYFVDFEASSLLPSSFPIEVAWVNWNGHGEHYLIRPHPEWLKDGCLGWSLESEAAHGISLETLALDGTPIERVAARAAKVLFAPGVVGFSDAPGWDGQWLDTLLEHGDVRGRTSLFDVVSAYSEACRPLLRLVPPPKSPGRERATERVKNLARDWLTVPGSRRRSGPGRGIEHWRMRRACGGRGARSGSW